MRFSFISALSTLILSSSAFSSVPSLSKLSLASRQPAEAVRASLASSGIPFENEPWHLSNIEVFESLEKPSITNKTAAHSYIVFNITDTNPQLEFSTTCRYDAPDGVPTPVTPDTGYADCENPSVRFKYDGIRIYIVRTYWYPEPSLPAGREYIVCFGNWNTSLHDFPTSPPNPPGVRRIQGCMEAYCTEMVS